MLKSNGFVLHLQLTVILIGLLAETNSFSATGRGPRRSIDRWVLDWKSTKKTKVFRPGAAAMMNRCIVVTKSSDKVTIRGVDPNLARMDSIMDSPSVDEVGLTMAGNKVTTNSEENENSLGPCESTVENAAMCFNADCILDVGDANWKLSHFNPVTKKSIQVVEAPEGKSGVYFPWIRKSLRYDGVVLDEDNGYLLTMVPRQKYPKESQALTIKSSSQRFYLSEADSKGSGLMQLHSYSGQYAIFLVLASRKDVLLFEPGTKFIMESLKR